MMSLYHLFLIVLVIALSCAKEIHFSNLEEKIVINEERIQAYTNDLTEEGEMTIKLKLDNGKQYNLSTVKCRVGKGQFKWIPHYSIPDGSHGIFVYEVTVGKETFSGESSSMKFVSSSSSDSSDSSSSSSSSSSDSSSSSSSDSSSSSSSADSDSSKSSAVAAENEDVQDKDDETQTSSATSQSKIEDSSIVNGNNTVAENLNAQQDPSTKTLPPVTPADLKNESNNQQKSNDNKGNYIMYIGGGSGIVVVAVTGILIAYKVKSKRNLKDYEFDSRPYNNTSMDISQVPNLLNGNLTPVNILGSPAFTDTSKNSQYGLYNNNNNPKSYRVPNIESGNSALLLSPSMSNYSSTNMNNSYFNNSQQKDKSKRNTYEMISPYDPRETSYNFSGNFDESLVLDNNGIINLNSNQSMKLGVDVGMKKTLPKSENYSANPRSGSLPRNRVPHDIEVPLMTDGDEEENKRNYRNSILSYISSNRGSYYGAAQAEHSISHILLNQVCTVAYASQPENDDELYLNVGDKVKILEVYDDGWAYSLQISTGLEGMIPINCTAEYYQ